MRKIYPPAHPAANHMISRLFPFTAALPALVLSLSSLRAADTWETDFEKAKAAAAKDSKDILMDFTGSDWCGWCIKLREEVFEKDAFKQDAAKHFVLLELDFPRESELSEETKKQNDRLQAEYRVEGFPTIVLADAEGRPYAMTGYEKGGAAHYVEHLAGLRKKRAVRDTSLKKAAAASGVEKAKLTVEALKNISPELIHTFYKKEIEEAIAADKEDTTGVKKSRDEFASEGEFKEKVEKLEEELAKLHDEKKFAEFTARIAKFIADEKLTGRRKQELLMAKLAVCQDDLPAAVKILDEVIAVDPESEMATQAKEIQKSIGEMEKQEKEKGGKKPGKTEEAPEKDDSEKEEKPDAAEKPAEKEDK
jgi:thioredoxin-related protein